MIITQFNVDCYGCNGPLNNGIRIISAMKKAAKCSGAKIIGSQFQKYPIQGVTAIVFLAESHILVTTYPEYNYATVEIFLCNEKMNSEKCWKIIKQVLKPQKIHKNLWLHKIGKKFS